MLGSSLILSLIVTHIDSSESLILLMLSPCGHNVERKSYKRLQKIHRKATQVHMSTECPQKSLQNLHNRSQNYRKFTESLQILTEEV